MIQKIAKTLNIQEFQVKNTFTLFEQGATIPFISRYRKEMTGALDEVQLMDIKKLKEDLEAFEKRKEYIIESLKESGNFNAEIEKKLNNAKDINELEDIYLPFKPKRKTKSSIAIENGLEPFAKWIFSQNDHQINSEAKKYLNDKVPTIEAAIEGAGHIIADWINENFEVRDLLRNKFENEAIVSSKVIKTKKEEAIKFKDYFEYEEKLSKIPSHRLLAIRRGEEEGFLRVSIKIDEEKALFSIERKIIKASSATKKYLQEFIQDAYKRLLHPSLENEFALKSKKMADQAAIKVFAENAKQLLLAAPLGSVRTLAIDPGFRTGCKVVCLDEKGDLIHNETIYPHAPQLQTAAAMSKINQLVDIYKIDAISIGNGTAGRETESFIKRIRFNRNIKVFVVNENGASIYSASKVAREEFPDFDVTVRGAVSIGRRLMDPLAELVKIDPKSIGVGQYQHDVDQKELKEMLEQVVENCVNTVGVNLNTASKYLLSYISGLSPQIAENIIEYRKENGKFSSRKELLKVKRMGEKTFEQAAGFLRIIDAENPLDNSAVHPERYTLVEKMAKDLKTDLKALISNENLIKSIDIKKYMNAEVGEMTLQDILSALAKPGLDPRQKAKVFEFDPNVRKMEDLQIGMILPGIVTNITNFGAFVDVGVKQDGLVHISQITDTYISDPNEYLHLNQTVKVKVLEIDTTRKRIAFSMKGVNG
jgi:protein Tex